MTPALARTFTHAYGTVGAPQLQDGVPGQYDRRVVGGYRTNCRLRVRLPSGAKQL